MFRLWLSNFGWYALTEYATLDLAIEGAKRGGYEVLICDERSEIVARWSILGGLRLAEGR